MAQKTNSILEEHSWTVVVKQELSIRDHRDSLIGFSYFFFFFFNVGQEEGVKCVIADSGKTNVSKDRSFKFGSQTRLNSFVLCMKYS